MRYLFALLALLALAPGALAQKCERTWFQITSRSGSVLVSAREVSTHTDRSGQTRVTADGKRMRTAGAVWVVVLGSTVTIEGQDHNASEAATPPASGVPIPYPDISIGGGRPPEGGDTTAEVPDVKVPIVDGGYAPGPGGGGVITRSPRRDDFFIMWSNDVKFEGKSATRFSDTTTTAEASGDGTTTTTTQQPGGGGTCESNPPIGN